MEEKRYYVAEGGVPNSPMSEGAAVMDRLRGSDVCSCDCWNDAEHIAALLNKHPLEVPLPYVPLGYKIQLR